MKTNTILTLLRAAIGGILLTGCQSNTVYFGHWPSGIQHVPAKGGTPAELVPNLAMVMGLACSKDGERLFVTQQSSIARWGTDGSAQGTVIQTGVADCVALDEKAGRIYWGDRKRNHIASCDLKGGDLRVLVTGVSHVQAVAVNPTLGRLYWVQETSPRGVWMSRLDGTEKHLISVEGALPTGLAVDEKSGRIFWSRQTLFDWPGRIMSANSDGSDAKVIVSDAGAHIEGAAVDASRSRIVWIERRSGGQPARIRSARFDGSAVETICEFAKDENARSVTVGPPRKDG